MAAKTKSSNQTLGFNGFINSPRFVKTFKLLIVFLALAAVLYGAYAVLNQKFSGASYTTKDTWYYNYKGIGHTGGQLGYFKIDSGGVYKAPQPNSRKVWVLTNGLRNNDTLMWWGPYKHLATDHQYIGCFYYWLQLNYSGRGKAILDITNNAGTQILRQTTVTDSQPYLKGTLNRTCMAFYIPKKWTNNAIELRVHYISGIVAVRATKITQISNASNNLYNQTWIKSGHDNDAILSGYGFTL